MSHVLSCPHHVQQSELCLHQYSFATVNSNMVYIIFYTTNSDMVYSCIQNVCAAARLMLYSMKLLFTVNNCMISLHC